MATALSRERVATDRLAASAPDVRVMLIDDSLTVRTVFSRMISRESDMVIAATASTAERGLVELSRTPVDVILLDLEMPGMGGLEALPQLLKAAPGSKILVISSLTAKGAEHTVKALRMGAADTMLKPQSGGFDDAYREQLLGKIRALKVSDAETRSARKRPRLSSRTIAKKPQVLAIGASTGGIHALNLFLRQVPSTFDLPILITQHLPKSFMPVFAKQMELASGRKAVLADENAEIANGTIVIAPGHAHMMVRRKAGRAVTALASHPVKTGCTPSVDPMFETAAEAYDGYVAGVLLSGMGRDGTDGAEAIIQAGGSIYAQSADTCAVWGMPRDVTERGLATAVMEPGDLATEILSNVGADAWR